MTVATTVQKYLDRLSSDYTRIECGPFESLRAAASRAGISPRSVLQAVPMKDRFGLVMAVISADRQLDFETLSRLMGRRLEPATTAQVVTVFRDCDAQFIPPLGEPYGIRTIIDDQLADLDRLYLAAGDNSSLITVSSRTYFALQANAWLCSSFTHPAAVQASQVDARAATTDPACATADIRRRVEQLDQLPPMPKVAQAIFRLSSNPHAGAKDLAKIVELDPGLAAQVIRYACSPFYSYQGTVDSVEAAISRVLGYDMVMHLALGLAASKPFRIQRSGPLGLDAYWRHAAYSAAVMQGLALELPPARRPSAGLAYLSGLLQNFGHLLLGHLFPDEFAILCKRTAASPGSPLVELERSLLGMDHGELGAWLLRAWGLPDEIVVAVREHHNAAEYNGSHAIYAQLMLVTDRMLQEHGMGDVPSGEIPSAVLEHLGLSEVQLLKVMNQVLQGCEGLNTMAQQLAA